MLTITASAVRTAAFARDNVTFDYTYDFGNYSDTIQALALEAPTVENTAAGTVVANHPVYGYRTYKLASIRNLVIHSKH